MKARVTLKDVAIKVGVHSSTVARVLNPMTRNMVTEEIAQKILNVSAEMGYRPNAFAKSLREIPTILLMRWAFSTGLMQFGVFRTRG